MQKTMRWIRSDSDIGKNKQAARILMLAVLAICLTFVVTACDAGSLAGLDADGSAGNAQLADPTDTPESIVAAPPVPTDMPEIEETSESVPGDALSPESVVLVIFDAAKTGEFAALEGLCDPLGENDGDTQMICDLATDETNRAEFVQVFASGRISGDATISPEGDESEVPFLFGPGDGDREETMRLINRDGHWYLSSF